VKKFLGTSRFENIFVLYFLFLPIVKIKRTDFRIKIYLFGLRILVIMVKPTRGELTITSCQNMYVYFDHGLGGGTETYFFNKLKTHNLSETVLRIQEINQQYKLSIFSQNNCFEIFCNLKELENILLNIKDSQIVINNLVSYTKILHIFKLLKNLKNQNNKIIVKGHDYYSICPSWHLINKLGQYCYLPDEIKCQDCYINNNYIELRSIKNLKEIKEWRKIWGEFYISTVDELIVFSNSSKLLFKKTYPFLENKISVISHDVEYFSKKLPLTRKTEYPDYINIVILGTLTHIKGREIILEIANLTKKEPYKNVKLTIIGDCTKKTNLYTTGKYKREDLPDLIEQCNADIVFISSIVPETFSYTISEAMSLDLPIASFNLGAQAEKLLKYDKGLIISKICPQAALEEIINFVKKIC